MNIVLIGYRGSGKSAVGRALAEKLGWPLVDTDALIEQRTGRSIREVFAENGEPAFRDLEAAVVEEVAGHDRHIISTGGGVILRASNTAVLKRHGKLIWLTAPPEVLWARIQEDAIRRHVRPNLTATGGLEEVRELLARRLPLYEAAAELRLDSSKLDPDQLAGLILAELNLVDA